MSATKTLVLCRAPSGYLKIKGFLIRATQSLGKEMSSLAKDAQKLGEIAKIG